ncbi:MAG: GHKL domain-containing protein [Lactobacillus delbrueckii]|nr:GHKL domain-containing protein [Lactobacillus delbrueckii]
MQELITYAISFYISLLFDFVVVYIIAGIKFERRQLIPIVLVTVLSAFTGRLPAGLPYMFSFIEAGILCGFYSKYKPILILNSLSMAFLIDILLDSSFNLLKSSWKWDTSKLYLFVSLLVYFTTLLFVYRFKPHLRELFSSEKTANSCLLLLIYMYVSTCLLNLAVLYGNWFYSPTITLSVLIVIQTLFAVIMFWFDFHIQKGLLNQQEEELREKYLQDLEASEDKVREFKHDYLNLLASLRESAQSSRDEALLEELADYSNTEINDPNLWKYKSLNHINNHALKGLIIDKLDRMNARKISYSLECAQEIIDLPAEVKLFDLIRVIGIALDNAIEESELLLQETGDAGQVRIDIMLYQAQPQELEFVVKNRCSQGNKIKLNEIAQKGISSKTGHKGYGLANVHEIQEKYENMFVEYGVSDDYFTFSMAVS